MNFKFLKATKCFKLMSSLNKEDISICMSKTIETIFSCIKYCYFLMKR
jgi:hypothetical protein